MDSDPDWEENAPQPSSRHKRKKSKAFSQDHRKTAYAWEEIQRSWDTIQEDAGRLTISRPKPVRRVMEAVQRGILRHAVLIVDASRALLDDPKDMLPSRWAVLFSLAATFTKEFYAQNPLGQLSVVLLRDGIGLRLVGLDAGVEKCLQELKKAKSDDPRGEASVGNALQVASRTLSAAPKHGTKEVYMLLATLQTTDPTSLGAVTEQLVNMNAQVHVLHLSADVYAFQNVVKKTNGTYTVAVDEAHASEVVMTYVPPPAIPETTETSEKKQSESTMMHMGFPSRIHDPNNPVLCSCHRELKYTAYTCPRCLARVCDIPQPCPRCFITLAASTHLARSHHHLFPVAEYVELDTEAVQAMATMRHACYGCGLQFVDDTERMLGRFQCKNCENVFCESCDIFVHDVLHNCPGCI